MREVLRGDAKRRLFRHFSVLSAAAVLVAEPLGATAQAQSWFFSWNNSWEQRYSRDDRRRPDARSRGIRERRAAKQKPPAVPKKEDERVAKTTSGPLVAVVSLASQRIRIYGSDGLIAQSPVSTGRSGHRTPTGVFSVIQKRRYHESNIYSNAPMPWMQRLTWSGIALHGGVVPGHPASHGCIRLTYDFAPQMWAMTRMGARIIVAPNDIGVSEFSHPRLPVPAMTPGSLDVAGNGTGVVVEVVADARSPGQTLTDKRLEERAVEVAPISPLERMRIARRKALAEASAAEKALKVAAATARRASAEANTGRVTLRRAQGALKAAENRLAAVLRLPEGSKSRTAAESSRRAAFETARMKAVDAVTNEALVSEAAALAASAVKAAQAVKDQTSMAVRSTGSAQEPISIFISRKAGRVFVRQGFTPLFDEAVTIRDGEMPIGTHVFTALAAENGGATVRWAAATVPDAGAAFVLKGRGSQSYEESQKTPPTPSTAAEALDRIELPAAVSAEVANRLWAGASLIISDQGLSNETGQGTDFIVLTKQ